MSGKPYSVWVRRVGGKYVAHLQVGNQGFDVFPEYDEDDQECAVGMVRMLRKAIENIIESTRREND